jgi:hypothetical protein
MEQAARSIVPFEQPDRDFLRPTISVMMTVRIMQPSLETRREYDDGTA